MTFKPTFDLVPDGYPFCIVTDCPLGEHCLRQKARQMLGKESRIVSVVNPLWTQPSEQCEFYRSDEPQVFARGFAQMQEEMLPRQYKVFMSRLQGCFGRTGYFERRRGDRLCSPKDISAIQDVLQELGLQHLGFDAYERHYNW